MKITRILQMAAIALPASLALHASLPSLHGSSAPDTAGRTKGHALYNTSDDSDFYPINFDKKQSYTHASRHLDGIMLNGGADGNQSLSIPAPRKMFTDLSTAQFIAQAGETLTAQFNFTGNWMNGYVYIDFDRNGQFDVPMTNNRPASENSDLVAYSYYNQYNSKGETVSSGNVLNPPAFTLPAGMEPGFYKMRYKVDWDNVEPGGRMGDSNDIITNGGGICDVVLNVHGTNVRLQDASTNGRLLTADGSPLDGREVPFGKAMTIKAEAEEGYVCDGLLVRCGYHLDGDSLLNGIAQYRDFILPGYLFQNGQMELPAEYLRGDVRLQGFFIQQTTPPVPGGKDYALNFPDDLNRAHPTRSLQRVMFKATQGGTSYVYPDRQTTQVYHNLTPHAVSAVPGDELTGSVIFRGDSVHYYLYVDLNQDGQFTPSLNEDGTPTLSGELLSYTYYNGRNSRGQEIADPYDEELEQLPAFSIPEQLGTGCYRARLKIDFNNSDPAGQWQEGESMQIDSIGGYVIDFLLNVHQVKHPLTIESMHGNIFAPSNAALPDQVTTFEKLSIVPTPVASGYQAEKLVIRHGHHFDGPQYIHGNRQWSEYEVPARSYTIPRDSVSGDLMIRVNYEPGDAATYQLVFSDEFNGPDGSQPDPDKWKRCTRATSTWNRWLSDSEEVVYLKDGQLVTRAIPNPDTQADPVPMITGGVESKGKFAFTYGRVECRAKINTWNGTFPAIWMMPENTAGGWPSCGEIDIFECINTEGRSYHTVHSHWTYDLGNKTNPVSSHNYALPLDRYHTYAFEWNDRMMMWYVDGKLVGSYAKSNDSNALQQGQWPFDKHFYLILNQSVGDGSWASKADVAHTYEFFIDWVRVYQKKGMENTDGIVAVEQITDNSTLDINIVSNGLQLYAGSPCMVNVCDLQGRTLLKKSLQGHVTLSLLPGIYLVNGKKVLVK